MYNVRSKLLQSGTIKDIYEAIVTNIQYIHVGAQ